MMIVTVPWCPSGSRLGPLKAACGYSLGFGGRRGDERAGSAGEPGEGLLGRDLRGESFEGKAWQEM